MKRLTDTFKENTFLSHSFRDSNIIEIRSMFFCEIQAVKNDYH